MTSGTIDSQQLSDKQQESEGPETKSKPNRIVVNLKPRPLDHARLTAKADAALDSQQDACTAATSFSLPASAVFSPGKNSRAGTDAETAALMSLPRGGSYSAGFVEEQTPVQKGGAASFQQQREPTSGDAANQEGHVAFKLAGPGQNLQAQPETKDQSAHLASPNAEAQESGHFGKNSPGAGGRPLKDSAALKPLLRREQSKQKGQGRKKGVAVAGPNKKSVQAKLGVKHVSSSHAAQKRPAVKKGKLARLRQMVSESAQLSRASQFAASKPLEKLPLCAKAPGSSILAPPARRPLRMEPARGPAQKITSLAAGIPCRPARSKVDTLHEQTPHSSFFKHEDLMTLSKSKQPGELAKSAYAIAGSSKTPTSTQISVHDKVASAEEGEASCKNPLRKVPGEAPASQLPTSMILGKKDPSKRGVKALSLLEALKLRKPLARAARRQEIGPAHILGALYERSSQSTRQSRPKDLRFDSSLGVVAASLGNRAQAYTDQSILEKATQPGSAPKGHPSGHSHSFSSMHRPSKHGASKYAHLRGLRQHTKASKTSWGQSGISHIEGARTAEGRADLLERQACSDASGAWQDNSRLEPAVGGRHVKRLNPIGSLESLHG